MKKYFLILFISVIVSVYNGNSQQVSCNELLKYVLQNGTIKGTVNSYQLSESKWLKGVTAYTIDNSIVVIAEIKQDDSFQTKKYIFCGITNNNWNYFYYGTYDRDKTYGERFHKYIFDYKCDCN